MPKQITLLQDEAVHTAMPAIVTAYHAIFEIAAEGYVEARLPLVGDPVLHAIWNDDRILAFKLGYRRGPHVFYSWLGGVLPESRRLGLGKMLMLEQHDWAQTAGYNAIETQTRTDNRAMIIMNLQCGFEICGLEMGDFHMMVAQRKKLAKSSDTSPPRITRLRMH